MHGLSHFLHKHQHNQQRESSPPVERDDSGESWYSTLSSTESRESRHSMREQRESNAKPIPINQRGSSAQRSLRVPSGSPYEFASSPRDRYPNFASYFRDVMEGERKGSPTQHHYHTHHPDYRRQRSDGERYQIGINTYHAPARHEYRNFVSPLYSEVMDDIQENEYSKCERYGEISSAKLSHKNRFDNKSFAQKLTESVNTKEKETSSERRGSGSSASGHRQKHHTIQELFRTFGKKVGHWRHEASGEGRRGSCAIPATSNDEARARDSEEFRSRSKSLDGDHVHKVLRRPVLEDCGATYEIFEAILREGMMLFLKIKFIYNRRSVKHSARLYK